MAIETEMSPVITVRGLAKYLRVHPSTVYRLIKQGLLPAFRVGSDWCFNREDIQRWRLAQTNQSFAMTGINRSRDNSATEDDNAGNDVAPTASGRRFSKEA